MSAVVEENPTVETPATSTGGARRPRLRRLWWLLIPLVFVGIPTLQFLLRPPAEAPRVRATPVEVTSVSVNRVERVLGYPGTIRAESTTAVLPKVSGTVTDVLVNESDTVAEDQVVVTIDDAVLRLQVEQARAALAGAQAQLRRAERGARAEEVANARASLEQARADLAAAEADLARTERLYEAGTVAQATFEDAQNQVDSARTDVRNAERSVSLLEEGATSEELDGLRANADAARRQLELAELQLSYARVTTPIGGTVASVMVDRGDTVGPQTALVAVVNDSQTFATVAIPERHYGLFRGREEVISVSMRPAADDSLVFGGRITSVAPVIDAATRTFTVEVVAEDAESFLRPGMFVSVEFVVEVEEESLTIPTSAALTRDGTEGVFVVEDGAEEGLVARFVAVELGLEDGSRVAVRGVAPGSRVISRGNAFLEDGQAVVITGSGE